MASDDEAGMAARLAEVEAALRRLASENDALLLKAEMKTMIDNFKTKSDSAPEPVLGVPLVNVGAPIVHSPKDFEGVSLDGKHKVKRGIPTPFGENPTLIRHSQGGR
jgi:hypothetical protein